MIVLLHGLWTPITLLLFVLALRPRANPLVYVADALHTAASTRGGRIVLAGTAAALAANAVECLLEPRLAEALGYDFTAWVRSIEGDAVERVQAALPRAAVPVLIWIYLSGFAAGLSAPAIVWTVERRFEALGALAAGYLANYALGLPLYLFFPVREAAWSGLSGAVPLIDAVFPGLSAQTRIGSGLDNCFPSLHVSLTFTAFVVALSAGDRALRVFAGALAALTAYVVVALGVHWVADVVAAVPFGAACAAAGLWSSRRRARGLTPVAQTGALDP